MTYFTNTTKSDITYKGKAIKSGETIMLDDHGFPSKGEYTYAEEKLLSLDDNIEKLASELKNKVTLADVNKSIQEVEEKTKSLVTSCTSQKKKTFDASYPWERVISCKDFINFLTNNSCTCTILSNSVPLSDFINLEPGVFVGNVLDNISLSVAVPAGQCSEHCAVTSSGYGLQNITVCAYVDFPDSKKWGPDKQNPILTGISSLEGARAYMCLVINKQAKNPIYFYDVNNQGEMVVVDYKTRMPEWAASIWNNEMKKSITSNTFQLQLQ